MHLAETSWDFITAEAFVPSGHDALRSIEDTSDTDELVAALRGPWLGVMIPSYGGNYFGWTRFSAAEAQWVSRGGDEFVRIAENQNAPCALVLHRSGRVGVSWNGEYTDMFVDLAEFVEAAAVWSTAQRWTCYKRLSQPADGIVTRIGQLIPVRYQGGSLTRWTCFDGIVVIEEPYLTGLRDRPPRVHLLAADTRLDMASEIVATEPHVSQELVGRDFPSIPHRWIG
jgi:hypothetical protein